MKAPYDQLALPFIRDEASLRDYITEAVGRPVALTFTDNTSSMLSVKDDISHMKVRMQRVFLHAGIDVIDEIIGFIKKRKKETPRLSMFLKNVTLARKNPPRNRKLKQQGRYYNLRDLYDSVNAEYFGGRLFCCITWGKRTSRHLARNRTLGSYDGQLHTIRINPVLDRKRVPKYFIAYVVYHEMLHADMGIPDESRRRSVHSTEFRKREKLYKQYRKALAWEKKYL